MIEFILGGIIGYSIGKGNNTQYNGGDDFLTIRTTGEPKELLSKIFVNYSPNDYKPTNSFWEKSDGTPAIIYDNGIWKSKAFYDNSNSNAEHDSPEQWLSATKIGKFTYIQIKIIHHSLYRKVTFDAIHLLKLLDCIENGAADKYIKWEKKLRLNGIKFNKGEKE